MPPPDDFFSVFLRESPNEFCVDCLTTFYGDSDTNAVRGLLGELNGVIEVRDTTCGNCDAVTTTYTMRRAG